jgi:hypothetical protein
MFADIGATAARARLPMSFSADGRSISGEWFPRSYGRCWGGGNLCAALARVIERLLESERISYTGLPNSCSVPFEAKL